MHFYQLLKVLYREAAAAAPIQNPTLEDLGIDEFKYYPLLGNDDAAVIATLTSGPAPSIDDIMSEVGATAVNALCDEKALKSPAYISTRIATLFPAVP